MAATPVIFELWHYKNDMIVSVALERHYIYGIQTTEEQMQAWCIYENKLLYSRADKRLDKPGCVVLID
jgi:hypothetical protein